MSIHDQVQELIPAYVLDALDADEAARVHAHVSECDECGRVLQEYRATAEHLAYAAPPVEPAQGLKAQALRRALDQPNPRHLREPGRIPASAPALPWWQRLGPALAGVALTVALVALAWSVWQVQQLNRQFRDHEELMTVIAYAQGSALTVRGTDLAPNATGRLYVDPDSNVAALVTVNMPRLAEGRVYQVWLTDREGHEVNVGTIRVEHDGDAYLLVRAPSALSSYVHVGVTSEPSGGATSRTGKWLLQAMLTPR